MYCKVKYNNRRYAFTKAQAKVSRLFRLLWDQHGVWTRATIISIVFDLLNQEFVIARLLRNPVDFEQALRPYYGQMLAAEFKNLLTKHLVIAADLVVAAKVGDSEKVAELQSLWYKNGDEIAEFLGCVNPFWSEEEWKRMYRHHLDLVLNEAVFMLNEQYEESVAVYDQIQLQALDMADEMAQGIIRQFCIN